MPRRQLSRVEIAAAVLDCKGCAWAVFNATIRIEGVEQATVSFKEGKATARIDAKKTSRVAIEEELSKRGVEVVMR
jgi:cation transport ATPase